jgi:hypothetical protein
MRVVEGDQKETWRLGDLLDHPVTGGHKYKDWSSRLRARRKTDGLAL